MAEVALAGAGALVIDLATKADLTAHHQRLKEVLKPPRARFTYAFGQVAKPAANTKPILADCGEPPPGMMWLPQWVTLYGDDPYSAAVANVIAAAFIGSPLVPSTNAGATSPPNPQCILANLATPSTQNVPDKVVVYGHERLYVLFVGTGITGGPLNFHATFGVLELEQSPEALLW
jgi:hypothetical protein